MAQQEKKSEQGKFLCAICLDLLNDPVIIPCGHNYCMCCIKSHWNGQDPNGKHSCPRCRQSFTPRPVLVKNPMLAELMGEQKKTDLCHAGPEDVSCDVCTGEKLIAVKSCLVCLVSYCEQHLQPHYTSAFENHKLGKPSKGLKGNICSAHNEAMKMFCHNDQQCICYLCSMNEHKGHEIVSVEEERMDRQKDLEVHLQNVQQKIQNREDEVKVLEQVREGMTLSADTAAKDIEVIINELVSFIKAKGSNLKQQIKSQQKTEESRVKELQKKLKQKITELKRKEEELKQLSDTENYTTQVPPPIKTQ